MSYLTSKNVYEIDVIYGIFQTLESNHITPLTVILNTDHITQEKCQHYKSDKKKNYVHV